MAASDKKKTVANAFFNFGESASDGIKLNVDGTIYTRNAAGEFAAVKGGETILLHEAYEPEQVAAAITKAFNKAKTTGNLAPHEFDNLVKMAEHYQTEFASSAKASEAIDFILDAKALRTAVVAKDEKQIIKLIADGADRTIMPKLEWRAFTEHLGEEGMKKFDEKLAAVKGLAKDLLGKKFAEGSKESMQELRTIFARYHTLDANGKGISVAEIRELLPDSIDTHLASHGLPNLETALGQFASAAEASATQLKQDAAELIQLRKDAAKYKGQLGGAKKEAQALEAITNLEKKIAEHLEEDVAHGAGFKMLSKDTQEALESSSTIKAAIGKATKGIGSVVKNIAEEGKGGIFTKGAKDLEKFAAKDLEGMKGFWNKRTGVGKTALIGIPLLILGSVIASTGNKGPGEHAEKASRDQGQSAMGVA